MKGGGEKRLCLAGLLLGVVLSSLVLFQHANQSVEQCAGTCQTRVCLPKKFAFIIPTIPKEKEALASFLTRWNLEATAACSAVLPHLGIIPREELGPDGEYHGCDPPDLIFFLSAGDNGTENAELEAYWTHALSFARKCFGKVWLTGAFVEAEYDVYPMGPTLQFYKLYGQPLFSVLSNEYTYFALIDHGVAPCKQFWLPMLQRQVTLTALALDFPWMMGTTERGAYILDCAWCLHLNGNAVYSLSREFQGYVNRVMHHPVHDPYSLGPSGTLQRERMLLYIYDLALYGYRQPLDDPRTLTHTGPLKNSQR